jgi:protein-S-isoprenylcysteine O-methyltransferase Ste14
MFVGRSGAASGRVRQDLASRWGIILQYSGAATVWVWRRPLFSPLPVSNLLLQTVAPIVAVLLAVGSVYFSRAALKTLGRQWGFIAGVTAGHQLIQDGPYAVIRHPLYTCFYGLTLAAAIVWTAPWGLLAATILFWIGVWIRVHTEEKVLSEQFGKEFEDYVKRVPAFFPYR